MSERPSPVVLRTDLDELRTLINALAEVGGGLAKALEGVQALLIIGSRAVAAANAILAKYETPA